MLIQISEIMEVQKAIYLFLKENKRKSSLLFTFFKFNFIWFPCKKFGIESILNCYSNVLLIKYILYSFEYNKLVLLFKDANQ